MPRDDSFLIPKILWAGLGTLLTALFFFELLQPDFWTAWPRLLGWLALGLGIGYAFSRLTFSKKMQEATSSLEHLNEVISHVVVDRDYSIRADKMGNGAFGALTDNFNHMLESMNQEQKEVGGENERLHARLSRSERMESVGVLAGGIAHDLNNILNPLVSVPELMLQSLPEDDPHRKDVEAISESAYHAMGITEDLLAVGRAVDTDKSLLDLNDFLNRLMVSIPMSRKLEAHPNVRSEMTLSAEPIMIQGSEPHLARIFLNLAYNAIESIEGQGTLTIKTELTQLTEPVEAYDTIPAGRYAVASLIDTGTGISEQDQEHIFEPFYSSKIRKNGKGSGHGLGLAVVYGILKDHKCLLDLHSVVGRGTQFDLYFSIY